MPDSADAAPPAAPDLTARRVRYAQLRPCTTAFIDTRTPGSAEKENFTIIGPGVSESPDQHVHIDLPHGFNIGAARQPPGCVNSQHSHETPEVFIIQRGRWAFYLGEHADDGTVVLEPGDTISIPIHVFRGFENIGDDTGFMFAVLGGDDPGHVMWAPYVFERAQEYGLILLEGGSLVDTTKGESIPAGKKPLAATTRADVHAMIRMNGDELGQCVVSQDALEATRRSGLWPAGFAERPIIGAASVDEDLAAGKMSWPHGFALRQIAVDPGVTSPRHSRREEEVILVCAGELTLEFPDENIELGPGDVMTVPVDLPRRWTNTGSVPVIAYVVRGSDAPQPPVLA